MDREALAWAAGLFEGEGGTYLSTTVRRGNAYRNSPSAIIVQVAEGEGPPSVLLRFQAAVGGLGRIRRHWRPEPNARPTWRYVAGGLENCQAVLAMLWPWLGPVKRAQAVRVLVEVREDDATRRAS